MSLARGPKAKVSEEPLPWDPMGSESQRFEQFCKQFLTVPSGHGVGEPLIIRDWQCELVASVLDAEPMPPRLAAWMMPRGSGKSSLLGALAVYKMFTSELGGSVVCCARSQGQAQILFGIARTLVETSPDLRARCQVGRERMYVPRNRTTFECLVSEPESLEGLNYSFCALDELGVTPRETIDVLMLAQGKRPESTLLAIGTPPADPTDSVLVEWRNLADEYGDEFITWREFSADGFQHHDMLCEHCIRMANPAYGDFLAMDVFEREAKTTREHAYRRARLCQILPPENTNPFIPPDIWEELGTGEPVPLGADVVLALDGSFNDDCTALLLGTVSTRPHFSPYRVWAKPADQPHWRVPVLEVETAIRDACKIYNVRELVADPHLWTRSLQILAAEDVATVAEFPWSAVSRVSKATTDLYAAAVNGEMSHDSDPVLAVHVAATTVTETDGGVRISKTNRRASAGKIDLAACMVMAHSRATWLATRKPKKKRSWSF
jgi:phage terminase large subunit-like protein